MVGCGESCRLGFVGCGSVWFVGWGVGLLYIGVFRVGWWWLCKGVEVG
jgi:hypothetical protein